jgi:muramoyltetrapeptide carboxypeptidase
MNMTIPKLEKGDLIYITAPAKSIDQKCVDAAKDFFEANGFKVLVSDHCCGEHHYFSGTDSERRQDFQYGLDHPEIKAIVCARGGYGCIRILDQLQWASMLRNPKFLVGFSDVTVFHQRMQRFGLESIHATMPLDFEKNTKDSLSSLLAALKNEPYSIQSPANKWNRKGQARGKLVGGNLSIVYSLLGTEDQIDYSECILFLEDVGEQIYHVDRMFYSFAKAGVLNRINGLVIGGMTDMKDTAISLGSSVEEIILAHFSFRKIPIVFDFPAGHLADNRALIFGRAVNLCVEDQGFIHFSA